MVRTPYHILCEPTRLHPVPMYRPARAGPIPGTVCLPARYILPLLGDRAPGRPAKASHSHRQRRIEGHCHTSIHHTLSRRVSSRHQTAAWVYTCLRYLYGTPRPESRSDGAQRAVVGVNRCTLHVYTFPRRSSEVANFRADSRGRGWTTLSHQVRGRSVITRTYG